MAARVALVGRVGDINHYIGRHGYDTYARENVETCCSLLRDVIPREVGALSFGFITYAPDIDPEYSLVRRDLEQHPNTFVLLPSFDRDIRRGRNRSPSNRPSFRSLRIEGRSDHPSMVREGYVPARAEDRNDAYSCGGCRRYHRCAVARGRMTGVKCCPSRGLRAAARGPRRFMGAPTVTAGQTWRCRPMRCPCDA